MDQRTQVLHLDCAQRPRGLGPLSRAFSLVCSAVLVAVGRLLPNTNYRLVLDAANVGRIAHVSACNVSDVSTYVVRLLALPYACVVGARLSHERAACRRRERGVFERDCGPHSYTRVESGPQAQVWESSARELVRFLRRSCAFGPFVRGQRESIPRARQRA